MNQLTWNQAQELATKAMQKAIFMGPREPEKVITLKVGQIMKLAEEAAFIALQLAGNLQQHEAGERRRIAGLADAAQARHDSWKRQTGKAC